MDPYIGRVLDNRYEILERIGTGGMAVVYKARDNRLNRLVAVKILKSDLAQDEDLRRRFNAESQAVASLSSPNIVAAYDVSRGGDTEYIVMELIDGITLKQYMEKRGQLNWRESLHFITQIMRGLAHAHSRGIVHRDIKPQNIMVLRDGSVKVADFGIAVLENAAQTLTQQALGSVHYISPEQARGERIDARSDIYSAGVVLYEMLSGRLPFEGESAVSVALQHLSSIPLNPRAINPDIPEQLELICMRAMAPDLARRYGSADEMIRDLELFRKNPGVTLDFRMEDLRPDVVDEPTRHLREDEYPSHEARGFDGRSDYTPSRLETTRRTRQSDRESSRDTVVRIALMCAGGIAAVVLAVVLFQSILGSLRSGTQPSETYAVPSVLGYTVERARELDSVRNIFSIREEGQKPSSDYPRGAIMEQDPAPEQTRKGGNLVIKVWVSTGEEVVTMPNVVNQKVTQAEKGALKNLIQRYDLTIAADEEDMEYSEYPAGTIISTIPAEGEELHRGDTIRLFLSKGPHQWELESYVGQNYFEETRSLVSGLKLAPPEIQFEYSDEAFGTVLAQDPEAGTTVREGSTVSFTLSRGPSAADSVLPTEPETEPDTGTEQPPVTIVIPPVPDPEPEPEPLRTPEIGDSYIVIPLPKTQGTGRLKAFQDDILIFNSVIDCSSGRYRLDLSGAGEVWIEAYLDDEQVFNQFVDLKE